MIDLKRIKLIIWDLDDTLWKGTLGEKNIQLTDDRVELIIRLAQRGIVNSICSKNNHDEAMQILDKRGIKDYFVFPSINWESKGKRVFEIIKKCRLRQENVLFIDDNHFNLEEVKFYNERINIAYPDIILEIASSLNKIGKNDLTLTRLCQYHLLEAKERELQMFDSNEDFLFHSDIRVEICYNVEDEFDRLFELMQRTNHLNYTKLRQNEEDFRKCLASSETQKGYVKVSDKYGDYGIVGFWVLEHNNALHFLFSCRILGMGIEQFIYSFLNYPKVLVKGTVSTPLDKDTKVPWINIDRIEHSQIGINGRNQLGSILLKGRCDLNNIVQYLRDYEVINESNYIDAAGHDTSLSTCTTNIVLTHCLPPEKCEIISTVPMFDCALHPTKMFVSEYKAAVLSLTSEYSFGVYQSKIDSKIRIAVGDYFYDMTNQSNWDAYINKKVYTLGYCISKESLASFAENFEKIELTTDEIIENILYIRNNLPKKTKLILLLGNDHCQSQTLAQFEENKLQMYAKLNEMLLREFEGVDDIILINVNDFLNDSYDVTDSIMHYSRRIYYNIAQRINLMI